MTKQILLLPLFAFAFVHAFAQDNQTLKKDLDSDGKVDTVLIDTIDDELKLVVLLSSQDKPIVEYNGTTDTPPTLRNARVGFIYSVSDMRFGHDYHYAYDAKKRGIRLIGMNYWNLGNAANDGSGKDSLNLLNGAYEGKWHHYDAHKQKLFAYPVIKTKISPLPAIYLSDPEQDKKISSVWDKIDKVKKQHGIAD